LSSPAAAAAAVDSSSQHLALLYHHVNRNMYVRSKELGSLEEEKDISPQD